MRKQKLYFPELPSFEDLKTLASKDPEALSALRKFYCDSYIDSVPDQHQHRLQCIQNRVEMELSRSKNPVHGMIRISGMMHESLEKLTASFGIDEEYIDNRGDNSDNVVPFKRPTN